MTIKFSVGKNKFDNRPKQLIANDFMEFKEVICKLRSLQKGEIYFSSAFKKGLHKNPNKYPGEDHYRSKQLALPRFFIAFDFDWFNSLETYKQLLEHLGKYRGFGYETWSHRPDSPRARAIIALNRAVNSEESVIVSKQIQKAIQLVIGLGKIKFDESVYNLEQPIYTPPKGAALYDFDGEVIDVEKTLAQKTTEPQIKKVMFTKTTFVRTAKDESPRKIAVLKEQLGFISADCPYNENYRRVIWAILSTGWDSAEEIARDWSMTSPERFNEETFMGLVNNFLPNKVNCPSVETIKSLAESGGWRGS